MNPSRRHAGSSSSSGLDYSTSCRIEEDVIWRAVTDRVAQNKNLSLRTPWTSSIVASSSDNVFVGFDFATARSVAKVARLESHILRLHLTPMDSSKCIPRTTDSILKTSNRLESRSSFSLSDLRRSDQLYQLSECKSSQVSIDAAVHDTPLSCCPDLPSAKEKHTFPLPRLVLQDKIPARRSSVSQASRIQSAREAGKRRPSEPFLPTTTGKKAASRVLDAIALPSVSNSGLTLKEVKAQSPQVVQGHIQQKASEHLDGYLRPESHNSGGHKHEISHDGNATTMHSPTSTGETTPPGPIILPIQDPTPPTPSILPDPINPSAPSVTCLSPTMKPASLLSGGSRTSAYRHALLQPSVSPLQPLDRGLPAQPILTAQPIALITVDVPDAVIVAADKSMIESGGDVTPTQIANISEVLQPLQDEYHHPESLPAVMVEPGKNGEHDTCAETTPQLLLQHGNDSLVVNSHVVDYWGFHPELKSSVETAIKAAVRKVIHQTITPPETDHHNKIRTYRELIAESIAEAARATDEYLTRTSTWNSPASGYSRVTSPHFLQDLESVRLDVDERLNTSDRHILEGLPDDTSEKPLSEQVSAHVIEARVSETNLLKRASRLNSLPRDVESSRDTVPELQQDSSITLEKHYEDDAPNRHISKLQEACPQFTRNEPMVLRKLHHGQHWLRELVAKGENDYSKLTKLPLRMYRHREERANQQAEEATITVQDGDTAKSNTHKEEFKVSENLSRTINDLEQLLNEALHIARIATETDDAATTSQRISANTMRAINSSASSIIGSIRKKSCVPSTGNTSDGRAIVHDEGGNTSRQHPPPPIAATSRNLIALQPEISPVSAVIVPVQAQALNQASRTSSLGRSVIQPLQKKIMDPKQRPSARRPPTIAGLVEQQRPPTLVSQHSNESAISPKELKKVKAQTSYREDSPFDTRLKRPPGDLLDKHEVQEFIRVFQHPPIEPRASSLVLQRGKGRSGKAEPPSAGVDVVYRSEEPEYCAHSSRHSLDGPQETESEVDFTTPHGIVNHAGLTNDETHTERFELKDSPTDRANFPKRHISGRRLHRHGALNIFSLRGKHHVSIDHRHDFSLSRSHKRRPIARDWSPFRKRFVAAVACISTALIGILIGIYAGEVPSIQYYIADFHHFAILGNVFMFIGLAISTFFCWPLPLLHGRKPYILGAMTIAMPLLFPQAIVVSRQRDPYTSLYRVGLILPRAFMGFVLGFANMNFMATLTDLFGASLQSGNPHQEIVDEYDVRRHGGGMGVWLGIWTWCYMGSLGVGFLIGSWIINTMSPDWGFYVSIIIIAAVLLLNVITPEVRRSPYRRSVAEVRNGDEVSRRLAKGEVMMHRLQTGPQWWGEEFHQGVLLSCDMLRQPGFGLMALYVAWIYGQIVLVMVLLGSLMSKYYHFISPFVGLITMAIPIGAMLAVPFQKASLFSRARHHPQRTDSMTFERRITWTSHLLRRAIFTLVLPFAGLAYTLSSSGPPTPFILPILFAGLIGFLSNLAIAECSGIIMEAFDTSDLQPGMTGRPRGASGHVTRHKRTNYSSFPRVSSAFAIIHSLGFLIAAVATGVGGVAQRHLGQQAATGVMAGILLILTVGVLCVLIRWKDVQIIPSSRTGDMERWERSRKESVLAATGKSIQAPSNKELSHRTGTGVGTATGSQVVPWEEDPWRPVIIGNPSGKTRRMSILELGHLSRWSEIRRRNRLVDEGGYEARHPNLAIVESMKERVREGNLGSLRRERRGNKSKESEQTSGTETGTE